jgi:hypothetical protein
MGLNLLEGGASFHEFGLEQVNGGLEDCGHGFRVGGNGRDQGAPKMVGHDPVAGFIVKFHKGLHR